MTVHRYDSADLLRLRTKACACVQRKVKRRLKYFRIYVDHVPVCISSREPQSRRGLHGRGCGREPAKQQLQRPRNLVYCSTEKCPRPRSPKVELKLPSLLLSNVRSLCNKMDEVEHRVVSVKPDVVVFTETWLDADVPDSCISLPGYNIVRKDRNKYGGGIIIYLTVSLKFEILNFCPVQTCESEILTVLIPAVKIVLIAIYHSFWKDVLRNDIAISCISDIIEHVFTLPLFDQLSAKSLCVVILMT